MSQYILAIDQGTTNSKAIVFDSRGRVVAHVSSSISQFYPHDGWVEQDPNSFITATIYCCQEVLKKADLNIHDIACVGISNQRETTILWDKETGKPIYPAIVWQDRRTSALCQELRDSEVNQLILDRTGLLIDPYFSATKIRWILDNVKGAKQGALEGKLLFGTVDSYLIWQLTKGRSHVTDITNASRTMLFNIHTLKWDYEIIDMLGIPKCLVPKVLENAADFGKIDKAYLGKEIPILGVVGDQQAAVIGQACFEKGAVKATYGTGSFFVMNTGRNIIASKNKLLSTIAYHIKGELAYALEGSIFCAGATVKWLRDNLHLIQNAQETEALAKSVVNNGNVYCIPAFTGLGAPYWHPEARGAFVGLTRDSQRAHLVRAALEAVAYQSKGLLDAMCSDSHLLVNKIKVDGGMTDNAWLLQFLADVLKVTIDRAASIETTALGAAYLAGLQAGIFQSLEEISQRWESREQFQPAMDDSLRDQLYQDWQTALARVF